MISPNMVVPVAKTKKGRRINVQDERGGDIPSCVWSRYLRTCECECHGDDADTMMILLRSNINARAHARAISVRLLKLMIRANCVINSKSCKMYELEP